MSVSVETVAEISRNRIGPVATDALNQHYAHWQVRGDHTELCLDGKLYMDSGKPLHFSAHPSLLKWAWLGRRLRPCDVEAAAICQTR
jgi:hypothetical protein